MEITKKDLKLKKYIDNKSFIKIFRTVFDEEEDVSGFLLDKSDDFMLMQVDSDFTFDGYAILKNGDYDKIRHSSFERTQRKIFNKEGLLDNEYGIDKKLPLTSWKIIFKTLMSYDFHVIIENTNKNYLDFWIGQIVKVSDKSVRIHNYNPEGLLDEKPKLIKYDSISLLKFGDKYSTTFRKYLRINKIKNQQPLTKAHM